MGPTTGHFCWHGEQQFMPNPLLLLQFIEAETSTLSFFLFYDIGTAFVPVYLHSNQTFSAKVLYIQMGLDNITLFGVGIRVLHHVLCVKGLDLFRSCIPPPEISKGKKGKCCSIYQR